MILMLKDNLKYYIYISKTEKITICNLCFKVFFYLNCKISVFHLICHLPVYLFSGHLVYLHITDKCIWNKMFWCEMSTGEMLLGALYPPWKICPNWRRFIVFLTIGIFDQILNSFGFKEIFQSMQNLHISHLSNPIMLNVPIYI